MQWFRWHRGLTENPKLEIVAREANRDSDAGGPVDGNGDGQRCYGAVSVTDVIAVWAVMLEDAASDDDWGVCKRDEHYIAVALRWWPAEVKAVMDAMQKHGMTSPADGGYHIEKWEQYQYSSDRDSTKAERQKRWRDKKKSEAKPVMPKGRRVTVTKTPETDSETDTETADDAREPEIPASLDRRDELKLYHETGQRVLDYLQSHGGIGLLSYGCVQPWLKAGFDPDLDIMPTIEMVISRPRDGPVNSLKYFDQAIANAHKTRTTPAPEGRHNGAANSQNQEPTNTEKLLRGLAKAAGKQEADRGEPGAVSTGLSVQKNEGGAR